ncbi:MAG TPA: immunoglobulin domain-containing protein [Opitutaceae bacterium]|jgi:sugar lactone lactonase YvrE|nr:immunoglobulin domain-containing protein [Opitutaceae bacterium]
MSLARKGAAAAILAGLASLHGQYVAPYTVATLPSGFDFPLGLNEDPSGNLWLCDGYGTGVEEVTPGGTVLSRLTANNPALEYPSQAVPDGSGGAYVVDSFSQLVLHFPTPGTEEVVAGQFNVVQSFNGVGTQASFDYPRGIARDAAGNLFVTEDAGNVRKIAPDGTVTTFASNLDRPWGLGFDAAGNLYVAESGALLKYSAAGAMTVLAGQPGASGYQDGTGAAARFYQPQGLAIDAAGNVYVADTYNRCIRKVTPGGVVTTLAGTPGPYAPPVDGPGASAVFVMPAAVAVSADGSSIWVSDDEGPPDGTGGALRLLYLPSAPQIVDQPQTLALPQGSAATLSVGATGGPPPAYQWYLDGVAIAGATLPTYTITNGQPASAGSYSVQVSNAQGTVTSAAAAVTVVIPPTITSSPQSTVLGAGGTALLTVGVAGTAPYQFQWLLNGQPIPGATSSSITVTTEGVYTVQVANLAGSASSAPAQVGNPVRLVNLSCLASVSAGDPLIVGFVTSGPNGKAYLLRAVGPTLSQFGVSDPLSDPTLTLYSGQTVVQSNAGWSGASAAANLAPVMSSVGAFPLPWGSADAALLPTVEPGSYTAQITAPAGQSGTALLEIYETAADLDQLLNLSARGQVPAGSNITAGLVIAGYSPMRVLLRGIGPGLQPFGIADGIPHPVLTLIAGVDGPASAPVVTSSAGGWSATSANLAAVNAAGSATGAFTLATGSADAAMVLMLNPGVYSLQLADAAGAGGTGLLEVYQVP